MRIKLTLGDRQDVLVTADATATVGDLARTLGEVTGVPRDRAETLCTHGVPTAVTREAPTVIDPELRLDESPLRSGTTVTLVSAIDHSRRAGAPQPDAALLRIIEGPDAGREFHLPSGGVTVGRSARCDVVLTDRYVSQEHLRITVRDTVEVRDLGSANGIQIGGESVQRASIGEHDEVTIGDTVFAVASMTTQSAATAGAVGFNRRPRVTTAYLGEELDPPDYPEPRRASQFPMIAMMAPLMMAGAMFGVANLTGTPLQPASFVFMAMSPLMMAGSFADQRRQSKKAARESRQEFDAMIIRIDGELAELQAVERSSRLAEHPSTEEATVAIEERDALLWTRRRDQPGFLEVRLGIGDDVARATLKRPDRKRATVADYRRVTALRDKYLRIAGVPVVGSLTDSGGIAVAGPDAVMIGVARGLVLQLAGLHSPADVSLVAIGSSVSIKPWDWLKWLPHVGSAYSPIQESPLASDSVAGLRLIAEIEGLIDRRLEAETASAGVEEPALVLIVLDDALVERSRLVQIAERGPAVGVHVFWCAASVGEVPAACRSFVELPADGVGVIGMVHRGEEIQPVTCESVDDTVALHVARRLAPLVDTGARVEDDSDLPRTVSFLTALGTDLGRTPDAVLDRWHASDPTLSGGDPRKEPLALRSIVGQGATEPLALDLRVHGPHALVGGTTGAGKSEFLQTWVLGMAASQSPKRITFLFVDYKGGSAFAGCTDLPHCVGLVTDLSPHLVRRALTSLRAELTHREEVLHYYGAKDLIELERNGRAEQMPSLVIVVDEFAALVQEVPDFVDGVIDVAQRGRSLGLHLVLATQRPSGVIKGNLRANTNLRIALRMADPDDSTDILGETLAAGFDPGIPGRAAAKTGPGRINQFQSLYVGGATPDVPPRPELVVEELVFGRGERLLPLVAAPPAPVVTADERTDIDKVVEQICVANDQLALPAPRRPWLDVLAPVYDWTMLGQRTDTELVIGVQDLPQRQTNRTVHFRPDVDGNMAVFGTGGSGKSTLLRTLAASAAVTPRGGPCDVYCIDGGSRGLAPLEHFPHVGAVIGVSDSERVGRLLRWLRDEVDERAGRYSKANATTITEYRALTGRVEERRLLVLIDGFGAFRQEYEFGGFTALFTLFGQLVADGRAVGVHFVLAGDRPGSVPPSLAANIQRRITLRLSDENDYAFAGVPADILDDESPPGRGILDGSELQVAVLGASASLPQQLDATKELVAAMARTGRSAAPPVERLEELIPLSSIDPGLVGRPYVGVGDEDLAPAVLRAEGAMIVVGPPSSGRTTTLATLVEAVRRTAPATEVYLFTGRRSPLVSLGHWAGVATDDDAALALASRLEFEISSERLGGSARPAMIVVEGLGAFAGSLAEPALQALVKTADEHNVFVVGEAETSAVGQAYGGLIQDFKQLRRGIALQPDEMDGPSIFKTPFPRAARSAFPPGRGYLVDAGVARRLQICLPGE